MRAPRRRDAHYLRLSDLPDVPFRGHHAEDGFPQFSELVARLRGFFEFQVPGVVEHLLLQALHLPRQLLLAHGLVARLLLRRLQVELRLVAVVETLDDVLDALRNAYGRDAALLVVGDLPGAAALGFADRAPHRIGDAVGVEDGGAVDVARSAPYGLDQRALGAQEAF